MPRTNDDVARLLNELAVLTEMEDGSPQSFRVRAYRNAVRAVAGCNQDVTAMSADDLAKLRGVGRSIAAKIREYAETGSIAKLEELRGRYPKGQRELMRVPGLGPKTIALLHRVLGVADVATLRAAIEAGRLRDLPGLGERTEQNLKQALDRLELTGGEERIPIARAMPLAERLVADLRDVPDALDVVYAGSLRRFRETIRDLDLLVTSGEAMAVMDAFCRLPEVRDVTGRGDTKASVLTFDGVQVDLRVVPPASLGAALVYFTGSREHNIRLRELAQRQGWTLNEYALAGIDDGKVIAAATEEDVYAALELEWIAPEMREDAGELALAAAGSLPTLPTVADLRGDLHDHTTYSGDGRVSLEDLTAAAVERGLSYLAITDHAENLTINGVSRAGMLEQRRRLRELEAERGDIRLLHGAELNIGIDGSVDYDPGFLAGFDWTVASVHSHFRRPVAEQTARVIAAMRNPAVTCIGHLTGRRIGRRPGIELDVDAVLDAAVETGTAIEINANLDRLDAPAEVIREGASRGVTFVISTDAHTARELENAVYGVRQARRGGLPVSQIANTWTTERFEAWLTGIRGT